MGSEMPGTGQNLGLSPGVSAFLPDVSSRLASCASLTFHVQAGDPRGWDWPQIHQQLKSSPQRPRDGYVLRQVERLEPYCGSEYLRFLVWAWRPSLLLNLPQPRSAPFLLLGKSAYYESARRTSEGELRASRPSQRRRRTGHPPVGDVSEIGSLATRPAQ
jgi:hypothetical protein